MKKYDTIVVIGRFQPLHNAHVELFRKAIALADHLVVVIGSAHQPRTYKNPWTSEERELIISNVLEAQAGLGHFTYSLVHNTDTIYNDQAWAGRVQALVQGTGRTGKRIGIIGHKKDESSEYLNMFPQWEFEDFALVAPLHATDIRDLYFRPNANMSFIRSVLPTIVYNSLEGQMGNMYYNQIVRERVFIDNYKKQYASFPYPPIFVTVDAVVICSGHVLMIKRKAEPGAGLWALPGGFVNADTDKSVKDAMIRELREETGIKVPSPVIAGSIVKNQVFDAMNRSARGRTITHAFMVELSAGPLPKVKGADDAVKARWVPIAEIDSNECFEDHFEIIMTMIGS